MKNDQLTLLGGALNALRLPKIQSDRGLYVSGDQYLMLGSEKVEFVGLVQGLYPFTTFEFDHPTFSTSALAQSNDAFKAHYLSKGATFLDPDNYYIINGRHRIRIPTTGWYQIEAFGAGTEAGRGSHLTAVVFANEGEYLHMRLGHCGYRRGGAGATAVWITETINTTPIAAMLVAGGAAARSNAKIDLASPGNAAAGPSWTPESGRYACGGASWNANASAPTTTPAQAFMYSTGNGGLAGTNVDEGGHGGGGQGSYTTSGYWCTGGGGGYTGGQGNFSTFASVSTPFGVSGTSFISPLGERVRSRESALAGLPYQMGKAIVTLLETID